MAAANRFLGANHTDAIAAAVQLALAAPELREQQRRRRQHQRDRCLVRSFDSEQSKCSEMSRPICRLRPSRRPAATKYSMARLHLGECTCMYSTPSTISSTMTERCLKASIGCCIDRTGSGPYRLSTRPRLHLYYLTTA